MNRSGKLHALLSTARVANVPSVVSNVWVGVVAAHFAAMLDSDVPMIVRVSFWETSRLALAGIFLYVSGNFLNDWKDLDWDRVKRPERALPAGLFHPQVYLAVAVLLAVLGMSLAASVNGFAAVVAVAIVLSVVVYTWCHKKTAWSVIPMGICRALLPVMGVAGISQTGEGPHAPSMLWQLAFGIGLAVFCYIVGLSLSARSESVDVSSRENKILSVLFLIFAPLLMMIPGYLTNDHRWILFIAPMAYLGWIGMAMSRFRKPVSRHVSALLAGIPLVDWIFLLPLAVGTLTSFSLACLIVPPLAFISALLLQRLAPAT